MAICEPQSRCDRLVLDAEIIEDVTVSVPQHPQNVIALVWDFDKTLIPGYMQDPIFRKFGIDAGTFWAEVNALPKYLRTTGVTVHPDTAYLNHLLTYVKAGKMVGLTNALLRELGAEIPFFDGLPDFFEHLRKSAPEGVEIEHYVVSTGLRPMIEGSKIADFISGIWASEFIEEAPPPAFDPTMPPTSGKEVTQIAIAYDNTSKTRALFEINKGSNKSADINVNARLAAEDRRVPFEQMIYIADGPSDVPAFSLMRRNGGSTLAVFDPDVKNEKSFEQAEQLSRDGRIDYYGPADFTEQSATSRWLRLKTKRIGEAIVERRQRALREKIGRVPGHIIPDRKTPILTT